MDAKEQYSEYLKRKFPPKNKFIERMEALLGKEDAARFFEICYVKCPSSIRCNTLKISPGELLERLNGYGWKVRQPFVVGKQEDKKTREQEVNSFPEIMVVESGPSPGDLGKTKEHLLGYYYVQEISSMLPMMVLAPKAGDFVLDLCASPGSKTTQAAAMMGNSGFILANELNMGRVGILNSNLERCGVMNAIVTRKEGVALCNQLVKKSKIRFDKVLVDAPCSGEGTLRKSPKTFLMWNEKMLSNISKIQRRLAVAAFGLLKVGGEMVYSTCTLAPEENEMVVDYLLREFRGAIEVEAISLPLKFREGVTEWMGNELDERCGECIRLYPQDNDTDGFFVARFRKVGEVGN